MDRPPTKSSNVKGMLLGGRYLYTEPGGEPLLVNVTYVHGEPVAQVLEPDAEDQGVEFDPRCATGSFDRIAANTSLEAVPPEP